MNLDVTLLGWAWQELHHQYDNDPRQDPNAVMF